MGILDEFEDHKGLLRAGDLIVIEIFGRIVPKRPSDKNPQWFVVLSDQIVNEPVNLKPFNTPCGLFKAAKYRLINIDKSVIN